MNRLCKMISRSNDCDMSDVKLVSVQDVEKELEVQIGMKQEMELSMKMLEKDICEKQDALVELRQQLEDLRAINQQLGHKSQVRPSKMIKKKTHWE